MVSVNCVKRYANLFFYRFYNTYKIKEVIKRKQKPLGDEAIVKSALVFVYDTDVHIDYRDLEFAVVPIVVFVFVLVIT